LRLPPPPAPLPAGLALASTTCAISGTPTALSAQATYTITASNTGGSATASFSITVNDVTPDIRFNPASQTLTKGSAISDILPTNLGGAITSCSITPTLPAGLSFDSNFCTISGTPSAVSQATTYTITASNSGGPSSAVLQLTVNDIAPVIAFSPNSLVATKGTAIATQTPTSTGGTITGCSASPALPAGLALASTTCALSGTPTALSAQATYTITATNSGGSASASFTLTVNDVAPSIAFSPNSLVATKGTAITTQTPTTSGGTIDWLHGQPSTPCRPCDCNHHLRSVRHS
jgi:hypothetical protein